jgi:HK97 family phage major capsid protein
MPPELTEEQKQEFIEAMRPEVTASIQAAMKKDVEKVTKLVNEIRTAQKDQEDGKLSKSEYEAKEKKLEDRIDEIETEAKRPNTAIEPTDDEPSGEKKAFEKWCRFGPNVLEAEERALLRPGEGKGKIDPAILKEFNIPEAKVLTISGDTGISYLAPPEYEKTIIKGVTEISPIRPLADVKPTSFDYSEIPKRTGQFAAVWVAEIGTKTETTGLKYGMERIPNHEMYALVKVSQRSLEDSVFNLEAELNSEFVEQFGKAEGTAFVTGDADGKPEGFVVNSDVDKSTVVFDVSDDGIILDGLIDLLYAPKTAYARAATIVANRQTIAYLRKAKDANNKYYWEPDWQQGTPGRFMGNPIVEVPDMANSGDGNYSMAYGNFKRGYVISDRISISIQRLVELYAESGQVGFIARKRVGGQVVLAEAIWVGVGQA